MYFSEQCKQKFVSVNGIDMDCAQRHITSLSSMIAAIHIDTDRLNRRDTKTSVYSS